MQGTLATSNRPVETRTRVLVALAVTVLYALCFVAIKAGLDLAPPLRFAGLRVLIAGLALLGLVAIRHEPLIPPRRTVPGLLTLAFVASTIVYAAMFLSPGRTGAGIASVLGNAQPLFTVALAALVLGERLTAGKVAALAFGIAGAKLISYPALMGPGSDGVAGLALALTVSAGSAVGNIVVKRLGPLPSLLAITAWALLLGSLPLLAISLLAERGESVTWSLEFLGLLLFLALPGTALATAMWYWLVQRSEVGQLAMFLFLVPVLGLVLAAAIFGERIGRFEGAGIVFVVVGIGVTTWELIRRAGGQTADASLPKPSFTPRSGQYNAATTASLNTASASPQHRLSDANQNPEE